MIQTTSTDISTERKWSNMTEKPENYPNAQRYEVKLSPEQTPRCPKCKKTMEIIRPTQGKYVITLSGTFYQWVWYYLCNNEQCMDYNKKITFGERLDYGKEQWGKDLLELIGEYVLQGKMNTEQIQWLLKKHYQIALSEHIIRKMQDDVLLLKANQINRKTEQIIAQKRSIILGIDGQDPDNSADAIWALVDLETMRLLRTVKVDSADHTVIHQMIEETLQQYDVKLCGVVSDKQSNIQKCMEVFYPDIPHQFCTFHFFYNIWKHLEMFDNRIHIEARKLLRASPLYRIAANATITVDEQGTMLDRAEVFEETRNDIIALCGIRSKTFEQLHGVEIYKKIQHYCAEFEQALKTLSKRAPLTSLLSRELSRFRAFLKEYRPRFLQCERFFKKFEKLYRIAYRSDLSSAEIKKQISQLVEYSWGIAQRELEITQRDDLRSFLPNAGITWGKLNGELVRLWDSYQTGLFAYSHLPIDIRTNSRLERGFSVEKMRLLARAGKKKVGFLMQTRGELVLRLSYASPSELSSSILVDFDYFELKQLRSDLRAEISSVTSTWCYKDRSFTCPGSVLSVVSSSCPPC